MTAIILVVLGLLALRVLVTRLGRFLPLIALVGLIAGFYAIAPGLFGAAVKGLAGPALLLGLTGFGLWWMLKGLAR